GRGVGPAERAALTGRAALVRPGGVRYIVPPRRQAAVPARARQGPPRGLRPPHPPPRPEPHVGVPEALLPRRESRDGGISAAAVQAAVHRDLRRGGRRSTPL